MKAIELIGKRAIRTSKNIFGDYSFTREPVTILYATDSHIIGDWEMWPGKIHRTVLNAAYCDEGWIDYDELMSHVPKEVTPNA